MPYDCSGGSKKKGLKTTAIALSLQTIGSIKSALIPKIYPTFYCDFLQVPHKQNDNFFCHGGRASRKPPF